MQTLLLLLILIMPLCGLAQEENNDILSEELIIDTAEINSLVRQRNNIDRTGHLKRGYLYEYYETSGESPGWKSRDSTRFIYEGENMMEEQYLTHSDTGWFCSVKANYIYNLDGNVLNMVSQKWTDNRWQNKRWRQNKYDANGRMVLILIKKFIEGAWTNRRRLEYKYNPQGLVIEEVLKDGDGLGWVTKYQTFTGYNLDGLETCEFRQQLVKGKWKNASCDITYYPSKIKKVKTSVWWDTKHPKQMEKRTTTTTSDIAGHLLLEILEINHTLSGKNKYKKTFERNKEGKVTLMHDQSWDKEQKKWRPGTKRITKYEVGAPNQTIGITRKWKKGKWVDQSRYISFHNAENLLLYSITQNWDWSIAAWISSSRRFFYYE